MKIKLIAINFLIVIFTLGAFIACNEDDDTDSGVDLTDGSWALTNAKFYPASGDIINLIPLIEPCGQDDVFYFYSDGTCELYKNGCVDIYGTYTKNGDNLTLTKGGTNYNYTIDELSSSELIISTTLYVDYESGTLREYYTKNQ